MIISLALVLFVTASGTLASYFYDEDAPFAARLCAGACVGIAALGLLGFVLASFLGLTPLTILLTVLVIIALPLLFLRRPDRRAFVQEDLRRISRAIRRALLDPARMPIGYTIFYLVVAAIFWRAFQRAMIETPEGIYTGLLNNFGDLPFHLSVITSFSFGNNFPPQDPTYAGVRFTYPFLTDFVSAIFVRCGADLRQSMFIENFVVALSFVGLLHRWALDMLRDKLAAIITPILVLLNGGFGWVLLWNQFTQKHDEGLMTILQGLPPSFTIIPETTWRWGNAISTLLIPQRGFLLGLPLAVIVFTQWWLSAEKPAKRNEGEEGKRVKGKGKKRKDRINARINPGYLETSQQLSPFPFSPFPPSRYSLSVRRMIAAGLVAGLLPLVHAHSFVVVMAVGACIALLQRRWRDWIIFGVVASIIALPQMWWSTHNSAVNAGKFLEWQFGWDHGKENITWFWLKNTGIFIPLAVAAILWRREKEALVSRRLLIFLLPFSLCFIVPNVLKMAPWIWDNIKVLFYWWLATAPLVALLIAQLWRGSVPHKMLAAILFASVTLAGALDVGAIVLRSNQYQIFNAQGMQFAELIKREVPPNALVIHAPVHNHPVFLTGRRSLMGYPGHVWTHGLEFGQRESEIKRVYAGGPEAVPILRKYNVAYAVVGPLERNLMNVNEQFFSGFQLLGDVGGYRLYKITQF
ncbi:MAG TPA: hypothetical protein VGW76_14355 [Pyrinomonadaceae bacterium]|nr:hypothetical protein [Pyrinomonadaceae bacterium]